MTVSFKLKRVSGTNAPVMDYDISILHHPFSMLAAGPRGAGISEFLKQLLSLKRYIMTNPPGENFLVLWKTSTRPVLFLAQEIPSTEF